MKKTSPMLFVMIILFFPSILPAEIAENWINVFSYDNVAMGEVGMDIVVDSERNSYVCGETGTVNYYDYDAFVEKISPNGETLWTFVFGDDGQDNWADVFRKMVLDEENDALYLVGEYCPPENPAHPQICLVKMNLEGEMIYFNTYGEGARGNDIILGNDGYIYISGATGDNFLLAKINPSSGNPVWISTSESTGMSGGGMGICQGDDGSIYQGGTLDDKWAVLRYNSFGNLLWYSQYESAHSDGDWFPVARFLEFYDGKIYAAGTVCDVTNNDIHLKCYNTNGVELWSQTFDGGYGFDMCEGMVKDSDGNFILGGHAAISETSSKSVVLKYSSEGELLWIYSDNVGGLEEGVLDIDIDSANDVYITGYRQIPGNEYPDDYLTQKLSSEDGAQIWEFTLDRDNTTDEAWAIDVFGIDDVFVTGRSHTWDTWYDVVTVNYYDEEQNFIADNQLQTDDIQLNNYPNPFGESTKISFHLKKEISSYSSSQGKLCIYNIKGEKIREFSILPYQSSIIWDGKDDKQNIVSNGIYFCKLEINGKIISHHKMILMH